MSGRGGRSGRNGRGGRGRGGRGRGHRKGHSNSAKKQGLCKALGDNVFDYGERSSPDMMNTTVEKIAEHAGAQHGQDIANELKSKTTVVLDPPEHPEEVRLRQQTHQATFDAGRERLREARNQTLRALRARRGADAPASLPIKIAELENEIAEAELDQNTIVPIKPTPEEKSQYDNDMKTWRERDADLRKSRGKVYSLILGQRAQLLKDKLELDTDWTTVSASYDPLQLYQLIEKTVLSQTEDQHPFATVCEQETGLCNIRQDHLKSNEWYDKFNTRVDVANAVGVTRQHKILNEFVARELYDAAYDTLTDDEKGAVRADAEERCLACVMLRQSSKLHANLKQDLQNDFTVGDNKRPKTRHAVLHMDEDCPKLPKKKAVIFHNLTAKMLYATKRARPDTSTSVAFLTTRVREPDEDDWEKLCHLMYYARGTKLLILRLSADGSGIIKRWIDASFATHPDMKGHTGGGMSLGRGFPISGSTKQKLNTRSSTETEVVGVDDFMPAICWTRHFMLAQGYEVNDNVLAQDNKASMLLEKNGKASSSKRTKHINIRYFFVTDRVAKGEVTIEWCPTLEMIGDYMTKPLQGKLFRKFRDIIMGVTTVEARRMLKSDSSRSDSNEKKKTVKKKKKRK